MSEVLDTSRGTLTHPPPLSPAPVATPPELTSLAGVQAKVRLLALASTLTRRRASWLLDQMRAGTPLTMEYPNGCRRSERTINRRPAGPAESGGRGGCPSDARLARLCLRCDQHLARSSAQICYRLDDGADDLQISARHRRAHRPIQQVEPPIVAVTPLKSTPRLIISANSGARVLERSTVCQSGLRLNSLCCSHLPHISICSQAKAAECIWSCPATSPQRARSPTLEPGNIMPPHVHVKRSRGEVAAIPIEAGAKFKTNGSMALVSYSPPLALVRAGRSRRVTRASGTASSAP